MESENQDSDEERTEEATPERREEAREQGNVVNSVEMTSVFVFAAALFFLTQYTPHFMHKLTRSMVLNFEAVSTRRIDRGNFLQFAQETGLDLLFMLLPIFGIIAFVAAFFTYLQTRMPWSWERLKPDFSRLDPIQGLARKFQSQTWVDLLKNIAKLSAVGVVSWLILRGEWVGLPMLMLMPMQAAWSYWGDITLQLSWAVTALLLVVAAGDFFYVWRKHETGLKMSKYQMRMYYKSREGDPQMKGRMRHMAHRIVRRSLDGRVKEATAVITNPTHYAVAVKYEWGMEAPIVVAKGVDHLALHLRKLARDHHVPIIENPPLARDLFASVKEGEEVPSRLFRALIEIIRYVFWLKGKPLANPHKKAEGRA